MDKRPGFTIIESLVTIGVVTFALGGLLLVIAKSIAYTSRNELTIVATNVLGTQIDADARAPYGSLTDGVSVVTTSDQPLLADLPEARLTRTTSTAFTGPNGISVRKYEYTLRWNSVSGRQTLTTIYRVTQNGVVKST